MDTGEADRQSSAVGAPFVSAVLLLASVLGACSTASEPSTADRCRELEPQISAEQAWDDIYALQEIVAEYEQLDCDSVLVTD